MCDLGKTRMNNKSIENLKQILLLFDQAINLEKELPTAYKLKAFVLNDLKEYAAAIDCFDLALKYTKENDHCLLSVIYANKGLSRMKLDDYKNALTNFDKALKENPTNVLAKKNRNFVVSKIEQFF